MYATNNNRNARIATVLLLAALALFAAPTAAADVEAETEHEACAGIDPLGPGVAINPEECLPEVPHGS